MRVFLFLLPFFFCKVSFAEKKVADDWDVTVRPVNDSLEISITTYNTKYQLTSLMQGLSVCIPDAETSFMFPSASIVRSKLKRHPNEVKAMIKRDNPGQEVKPDLQPLIQALSDTTAVLTDNHNNVRHVRSFWFKLDKENAVLTFYVRLPLNIDSNSVKIIISSEPGLLFDKVEFTGKRLSRESRQVKNGLGEAPMKKDVKNRMFRVEKIVKISDHE